MLDSVGVKDLKYEVGVPCWMLASQCDGHTWVRLLSSDPMMASFTCLRSCVWLWLGFALKISVSVIKGDFGKLKTLVGMMTNIDCQFDGTWNCLGDTALGMSTSEWYFTVAELTIQRLGQQCGPPSLLSGQVHHSVTAIAGVGIILSWHHTQPTSLAF